MAKHENKKTNIFSIFLRIVCVLIVLALVLASVLTGVVIHLNSPVQDYRNIALTENDAIRQEEDGSFLIDVRRGESSQSVGLRLERAGLIRNRYFWNLLSRLDSEYIKTGSFRIEMPASQIAIRRLLVSGREILHKVTIPEGVTLNRTA